MIKAVMILGLVAAYSTVRVYSVPAYAPGEVPYATRVAQAVASVSDEPEDLSRQYYYGGYRKTVTESPAPVVVNGEYSLVEPDGSTRIVSYIADDPVNGYRQ